MSSRILKFVFTILLILTAIVVSSTDYVVTGITLGLMTLIVVYLARQIDRHFDRRESVGLFVLMSIAVVSGSFIGALYTRTTYSSLLSLSITLSTLVYVIAILRGAK